MDVQDSKGINDDIEDLIEEKVNDQVEKIVEKKVKERINKILDEEKKADEDEKKISRREFLKKTGLGTLGIAAATLIPSTTALDVKSDKGLQVYQSGIEYLDVTSSGVNIKNTKLNEQGRRVATRNWTNNNFNNYSNSQAVNAVDAQIDNASNSISELDDYVANISDEDPKIADEQLATNFLG